MQQLALHTVESGEGEGGGEVGFGEDGGDGQGGVLRLRHGWVGAKEEVVREEEGIQSKVLRVKLKYC